MEEGQGTGKVNLEDRLSSLDLVERERTAEEDQDYDAVEFVEETGGGKASQFPFNLPEEVWELILNLLTEEDDLINCCRAHPYLDFILQNRKPFWLFKKVLPSIYGYLDISTDAINLRRVCPQWSSDVDNFIQSQRTDPATLGSFPSFWYDFHSRDKLARFLQLFSNVQPDQPPRNPFLDRTILISNLSPDVNYRLKVKELLVKFGRHLWMLQVSHEFIQFIGRMEWYTFLQDVIRNTPNLKKVVVFGLNNTLNFAGAENDFILNICGHMVEHPSPRIPSLEFVWSEDQGNIIQNMLVLPHAHYLKLLGIGRRTWSDLWNRGRPNLSYGGRIRNGETDHDARISLPILLKILRNFPFLEELSLNWNTVTDGEEPSTFSHLHNETVRSVTVVGKPISFNFLEAFKSLRSLNVELSTVSMIKGGEVNKNADDDVNDQFYKILEGAEGSSAPNIYQSKIWELLPSLASIEIISGGQLDGPPLTTTLLWPKPLRVTGSRNGYEEYQRKK